MRAGLEARVHAARLSALDFLDHFGACAVRDVDAAAGGFGNEEHAVHGLDLGEDRAGGDVVRELGEARLAGRPAETVGDGGVLAVHDQEAVFLRNAAAAFVELEVGDVLEVAGLARAAGGYEGLEGRDARIGERRQIVEIPRHEAAHRGIIGPALSFGAAKLEFQRLDGRRGGDRVERHFHEGRDAARGHGLRAGLVAFPFGAAGFAHVHVRVDHAGHDVLAGGVDRLAGVFGIESGRERGDAAVANADVKRFLAVREHDAAVLDQSVEHVLVFLRN